MIIIKYEDYVNKNPLIIKKIEEKRSEWKRAEEYCALTKAKNENRHDNDVSIE